MKKVLFGFVGVVALIVAGLLVAPGFIDWNQYKGEIAAQVRSATGRDLAINGDIRLAVLPSPRLSASEVSFANAPGAASPHMARLKSIEVRVALGPLFAGTVEVETIRLVDPVIELEVLANGRKNWDFGEGGTAPSAAPPKPGSKDSGPSSAGGDKGGRWMGGLRLDSFVIENGTLVYRDAASRTVERIDEINATIVAASLAGPIDSKGRLKVRNFPLSYDVTLGQIVEGRTMPLTVAFGYAPGGTKLQIAGTLTNLLDAPKFRGKLKGEGDKLAGLVSAFNEGGSPLPAFLEQAFGIEGSISASATGAEIKDLALRFGEAQAAGGVSVEVAKTIRVAAELRTGHVDIDKWLKVAPAPPAKPQASAAAPPTAPVASAGKVTVGLEKPGAKPKPTAPAAAAFALPANVNGTFAFFVDAITYRGGKIGHGRLNAELANGEVTLSQLSAQFPGGSEFAMFGFVSAASGKPRFEGEIEASISDLRGVMTWLGIDAPNVPSDRLRKVNVAGKIAATPEQGQISGLDLQFDSSRLTGGVVYTFRERPSFGANLNLDRINIDAYIPKPSAKPAVAPRPAKAPAAANPPADPKKTQGKAEPAKPEPESPLAGLSALADFDANVKARIETLVYEGAQARGIALDATLYNGSLDIRDASINKAAGASLALSGSVKRLASIPELSDVRFTFNADDPAALMRLAGLDPPPAAKKLGAVGVTGKVSGTLLKPELDVLVKAAGAEAGLTGSVALAPAGPSVDATIRFKHGDVVRLLELLDVAYRPSARIGGVELASGLKATATEVALSAIRAKIGPVAVDGSAMVNLAGPRPKLSADLKTGPIVVDQFMPAKKTAFLAPEELPAENALLMPASFGAGPRPDGRSPLRHAVAAPAGPWTTDPIDLSFLGAFDGDVKLKSPSVTYAGFVLENADMAANVANGVLKTDRLTATVFGGALQGNAQVASGANTGFDAAITLKGADLSKAPLLAGEGAVSGIADLDVKLAAVGASTAAMISTLRGGGQIGLKGLDGKVSTKGMPMLGGVLQPIFGLTEAVGGGVFDMANQLSGRKGKGTADVTCTFTADRGIVTYNDLRITSALYDGKAAGRVDLPNWRMAMKGEVTLAQSLIGQLLTRVKEVPQTIPFELNGPIDKPTVKMDTKQMPGGGLSIIPGVDKLKQKQPGVGTIIEGILGGSPQPPAGSQPAPSAPQAQPQQPSQQQAPQKPKDMLKDLFKPK